MTTEYKDPLGVGRFNPYLPSSKPTPREEAQELIMKHTIIPPMGDRSWLLIRAGLERLR